MSLEPAPVLEKVTTLLTMPWKNWFNSISKNVNDTIATLTSLIATVNIINAHLGPLVQIYHTTADIDFGSVAAGGVLTSDVALAGVIRDDTDPAATIVTSSASVAGLIFTGFVQANDNIRVRANNYSNAAIDPGILTFSIVVIET
jgi:hypothetical protein